MDAKRLEEIRKHYQGRMEVTATRFGEAPSKHIKMIGDLLAEIDLLTKELKEIEEREKAKNE